MYIRELFPILSSCTYLNTASTGLLSSSHYQWRRQHDTAYLEQGSYFRIHQADFLCEVKASIARFIHANPSRTYLIPNFSFGFNTVLNGLAPKQRILLLENDYPSINYAVQKHAIESISIPLGKNMEEDILQAVQEHGPTVFAFSMTQYLDGLQIDLDFLKDLKQRYSHLLLVADATQYCGARPFDFEKSAIDILICSGYKWLLAGYGNGFVCLKEDAAEQLFAVTKEMRKPQEPFLQDKDHLSFFFEPGHQDTLSYGTLQHSLQLFEQFDFPLLTQQLQQLAEKAKEGFIQRGLLSEKVAQRRYAHSNIFSLHISTEKYQQLQMAKIVCLPRGEGIRVAFHIYNTADDLDHLLEVLDT
ncbi:aminotransferase class V-fold PLP-dependent enzyme [Olivibacter sitiensis]|uniref:aminotransferase class V-fold PLP-dependent enzyme n=1 Tax=Olivibacter sitiensis TaxID=376470 RepID=UPI00040C5F7C|nr:aminotransferase class V-fold PLP-dependent enzyme [Olivibacter sitiensis]